VGADEVAERIAATGRAEVVRTGSRGLLWLEPMVEVQTDRGRGGADLDPLAAAAAAQLSQPA